MSTVVDLASVREERKPHWSGACVCIGCRHEWVGVGAMPYEGNLQCPACELPKGVAKYPFGAAEGDMVLTCSHCAGEALTAYMRGGHHYVRCMGCGSDLTDVFFSGD